ncbi:MAG: hypothetical protein ABWY11_05755 [Umezawaea sp.]
MAAEKRRAGSGLAGRRSDDQDQDPHRLRGRWSDQVRTGDHRRRPSPDRADLLTGYHLVDHGSPHVSHVFLASAGRTLPW